MNLIKVVCVLLGLTYGISSCVENINIDLPDTSNRVVFNASIDVKGIDSIDSVQFFYIYNLGDVNRGIVGIPDAKVSVKDDLGNEFPFKPVDSLQGTYVCDCFFLSGATEYELNAEVKGVNYRATEKWYDSPVIDTIIDVTTAQDESGVKSYEIFFNDDQKERNYYELVLLLDGEEPSVLDDEEAQGRTRRLYDDRFESEEKMSVVFLFWEDSFEGSEYKDLSFSLYEMSESFYNYLMVLYSQSYQASPFSPAPSTVKGNVINLVDQEEAYPLGYFKISKQSIQKVNRPEWQPETM